MKVFIIASLTADGFIGRTADHLADWTSKEDKRLFVKLTKDAGVIVMGSSTFKTIGRALPERRNIVYTSKPDLIVVDGIETTSEEPAKLTERLRSEGANAVAICGGTTIYTHFIKAGLVDELYLTIEPILFGKGLPLFNEQVDVRLELLSTEMLNEQTILVHYKTIK